MKQSRIPHAVIGSISHRVSKLFISVIQNQVGGLDIKGLPRVIHSVLVFKALEDMVIFFFPVHLSKIPVYCLVCGRYSFYVFSQLLDTSCVVDQVEKKSVRCDLCQSLH